MHDWSPWTPPYPAPGTAYATPARPRRHRHRRPSRLRLAARALARGTAHVLAAPLYVPHVLYLRLETRWISAST